jgi:hypothetical protein
VWTSFWCDIPTWVYGSAFCDPLVPSLRRPIPASKGRKQTVLHPGDLVSLPPITLPSQSCLPPNPHPRHNDLGSITLTQSPVVHNPHCRPLSAADWSPPAQPPPAHSRSHVPAHRPSPVARPPPLRRLRGRPSLAAGHLRPGQCARIGVASLPTSSTLSYFPWSIPDWIC